MIARQNRISRASEGVALMHQAGEMPAAFDTAAEARAAAEAYYAAGQGASVKKDSGR